MNGNGNLQYLEVGTYYTKQGPYMSCILPTIVQSSTTDPGSYPRFHTQKFTMYTSLHNMINAPLPFLAHASSTDFPLAALH